MHVVVDTNILVSGLLNPFGAPAAIIGLILEGKLTLCYDSRIIWEYQQVLSRRKFHFEQHEINAILEFIKENGFQIVSEYNGVIKKIKMVDKNDLPFIEVACTSNAEYLITGNIKHFPKKIGKVKVISTSNFLKKFIL